MKRPEDDVPSEDTPLSDEDKEMLEDLEKHSVPTKEDSD